MKVPMTILNGWYESLKQIDPEIDELKEKALVSKFPAFKKFFETHCTARTYFFQVFKCNDSSCKYHKPLRGNYSVDRAPDPVPYLDNVLPLKTIAQNAKNVLETISCQECQKPRLLYSPKRNELKT